MPEQPLVSIIIPTYNRAHLIGETLDSVLAQTYTNWECVVVDDGSTDETEALLKIYIDKDSRFQYHKRPDTHLQGGNGARNYGFDISSGEYVNWFDSDDIMHSSKLDIQVSALIEGDFNFCVCQTMVFEETIDNCLRLRHARITSENLFRDFVKTEIRWLTQAPLWKRQFLCSFEELFDETLKAGQDWEFHCRVLSINDEYLAIDTPLVFIRKHENNISNDLNKSNRNWNYMQARLKVSKLEKVRNSDELMYYLNCYNLKLFKKLIIKRYFLKNLKPLSHYFLKKNGLSLYAKIICLFAIVSFLIFYRGQAVLNKVSIGALMIKNLK